MDREEPPPISIIAITAAIPIMIPRQVSTERITFRRSASKAVRKIVRIVFIFWTAVNSTSAKHWQERVFRSCLSTFGDLARDDLLAFAQQVRGDSGVRSV